MHVTHQSQELPLECNERGGEEANHGCQRLYVWSVCGVGIIITECMCVEG